MSNRHLRKRSNLFSKRRESHNWQVSLKRRYLRIYSLKRVRVNRTRYNNRSCRSSHCLASWMINQRQSHRRLSSTFSPYNNSRNTLCLLRAQAEHKNGLENQETKRNLKYINSSSHNLHQIKTLMRSMNPYRGLSLSSSEKVSSSNQ